jgi:hypothetical protein
MTAKTTNKEGRAIWRRFRRDILTMRTASSLKLMPLKEKARSPVYEIKAK